MKRWFGDSSLRLEVEVVIQTVIRMPSNLHDYPDLSIGPLPPPAFASDPLMSYQFSRRSCHFVTTGRKKLSVVNSTCHLRHVPLPQLDMNPSMLKKAGAAGLLFASCREMLVNPLWMLFICMDPDSRGMVRWKYF